MKEQDAVLVMSWFWGFFPLIKAPANTCTTFPIGKGFQPYYNVAST